MRKFCEKPDVCEGQSQTFNTADNDLNALHDFDQANSGNVM